MTAKQRPRQKENTGLYLYEEATRKREHYDKEPEQEWAWHAQHITITSVYLTHDGQVRK